MIIGGELGVGTDCCQGIQSWPLLPGKAQGRRSAIQGQCACPTPASEPGLSVRRLRPSVQPPRPSWLHQKMHGVPCLSGNLAPQMPHRPWSGVCAPVRIQELKPRGGPGMQLGQSREQLPSGDTQLCPPHSQAHLGSL